jgi:transcriptional regulator with XRE-family HTH domain
MLPLRNLTAIRKQRGLTQAELAHRVNSDASSLRRLERGARDRHTILVERIASELGCDVLALYGLQPAEESCTDAEPALA